MNAFESELLDVFQSSSDSPKTEFSVMNVSLNPKNIEDLALLLKSPENSAGLTSLSLVGARLNNSTQLTTLFDALKENNSIKVLNLSDNPLGDDGIEMLAQVVKFKHNIVEVYVSDTGISSEGCKSLKGMLEINKKVNVLDVSNNDLGDEGVKYICQGILDSPLGEKSEIMKLNLAVTQTSDMGSKIIGALLASCPGLRDISLANNRITKDGAKYISHGLMKKHVNLVNSGALEGEAGEAQFQGLEVLNLSHNPIGDEGVGHIAKRLPASGAIKLLYLEDVDMKANSLEKLCRSLIDSDTVEKLNIGANPIESDCLAKNVIDLVTNTSCLSSLNLCKINLSKEDIKTLGDFLGQHIRCRLRELNLSETGIDDEGAMYIANGIKFNMDLKVLNVTGNPFGPKGAKSFAKVFKRAKQLETFYVTGQSRIKAEGENYLAECLKYNKKIEIKGASRELDYMSQFVHHNKAFVYNEDGEIVEWSEDAWEVVKRGCGQIIGTVVYNLSKTELAQVKKNVLRRSRNVVNQDMFEHVLRNAEAPALDVVAMFINRCKLHLDMECLSLSSSHMAKEKRKSDDVTYRFVAKEHAKDPMVQEMAKNKRLFLGRYLTENGPAVHETHEITRFNGTDTMATEAEKKKKIFVQIYENEMDFVRECKAREDLKNQLAAGGPFAIYDTILKEVEIHEDNNVASFKSNITDLRHCINNLGVTAGYDLHETIYLAKRAAQCLGTINNLGRIHGDFRPRNFLKVAKKRVGQDPVGRSNAKVILPDKWVVFDLSKSVPHGEAAEFRMNSSYMPPEIAKIAFSTNFSEKQLPLANEKIDVWSFGVVLYQLLTGVHLFHAETNTDRIFKAKERLQLMNWINLDEARQKMILHRCAESLFKNKTTYERIKKAAVDLVNWCLQGDPYNRPTFDDILRHPFFEYRTHVDYTDIDLLLGWYEQIGSDITAAKHKNNRTHAHVVNTTDETAAIFNALKFYFSKAGCTITNDKEDWKVDIDKRREKVQKAKSLIILLEKDVMWKTKVIQKILWAMDSLETNTLILLDISTAFTKAEKFDFDEYINELQTKEGQKKLDDIVKSLTPIEEKLYLTQIPHESSDSEKKQKKWLRNYILDEVNEYILSLRNKVMPFRTRDFLSQAMVCEIMRRSGFIDSGRLRKLNLFENQKELYGGTEEDADAAGEKKEQGVVKVLVLYNERTTQVSPEKLRSDALGLRQKLVGLESSKARPEITLIGHPDDTYKHFTMEAIREKDAQGKVATNRILKAETTTLVLCMVSQGFYEAYREQMLLLNSARGLVTVLPISYDLYDVSKGPAQEEVLNLGLENSAVLEKLKDNKSYIPLPSSNKFLKYETDASLKFILQEAEKSIELAQTNETKDENDAYVKYTKSNFFNSVY